MARFAIKILHSTNSTDLFGGCVGSLCWKLFAYKFKHDEICTFAVGHGAVQLTPPAFG